jgi:hypothetical protein
MSADTRTVSFLLLLRGLSYQCGLNPGELGVVEAAALAEHLGTAARKALQHYDWPDAVFTEHRSLRPAFSLGATYSFGDEVYDQETDRYYRAIMDGFAGQAITDGMYWESARIVRSMALYEAGETPIGEVLGVYDRDPDTDGAQPLGFRLGVNAVLLDPCGVETVWIRFRVPPPKFTTTAWDEDAVYQPGQLVFLEVANRPEISHAWLALDDCTGAPQGPIQAPARWRVQDVPIALESAVKRLAKAEWLSAQSQDEKAIATETLATTTLDEQTALLSDQQQQTRRYGVANRSSNRRQLSPAFRRN